MSEIEFKSKKIIGVLNRIIFKNEDNYYQVLSVDIPNHDGVNVTITQPNIHEGVTYEFQGTWLVHAKFGHQFKADIAFEVQPSTKEGLRAYLQSSFFPGIGPAIANRIVEYFGDNVINILNTDSDQLLKVKGISPPKLIAIKASWEQNKEINDIMMFLQNFGISTLFAAKIYEFYGKNCVAQINTNPYKLASDITGIGFTLADKIALKVGFAEDSAERIKACINFILDQGTMDGHCYLLTSQIAIRSTELLKVNIKDKVQQLLDSLERSNEIKTLVIPKEEKRYYSRKIYFNETYCAEKVHSLLDNEMNIKIDDKLFDSSEGGIQLSEEQTNAVRGVLSHGISILTGGPGVGKCLKKGTLVLMFNGSKKKVEDITIGDLLMGDDSTQRKVLSLANGKEKIYDIISNDGKDWGCNESHILSLVYNDSSRNCIINGKKLVKGDIIDISVKDYLALSTRKKHHLKQYSTGIEFPNKKTIIPPYLLGLWLGDGSHRENKIFNTDEEVFEYGKEIANEIGLKYKKTTPKTRCEFMSFTGTKGKSFTTLLRKYNLFGNKHIPEDFLINSKKNRLELIAGLIDSDGYLTPSGCFEITLTNKELSYQIQDLILSSGIRCSLNLKKVSMKRKDGSVYKTNGYRLIFSDSCNQIPTKIKRKISNNKPNKNQLNTGFKLIDKGLGEYYGFEIDGNHRFVLGNYIVTHNTQTTKKIVHVLHALGKNVILAAPTGRASQRMTELIGAEASTVHRLLSWDHLNGGFLKNENNPISADFIIIDESSMLDINLASALLKATQNYTQILFIGDPDQLPPVGPGDFFRDLMESGAVPVYRLNKIFRQGKESLIIKYAHQINSGVNPSIETPLLTPEVWTDGSDCCFVDSGMPEPNKSAKDYPKWSSLRYGLEISDMIIKLYTDIMPKYLGKEKETQILIPMNIGDMGTIRINSLIQNVVNPHEKGKGEIKLKEKLFRKTDKVIQTKNNYDLGVFNGDIGRIVEIDGSKNELVVKYSEDREVSYKKSEIFELDLAYAISIHKSQGSEFDCVIIPITSHHYRMLYRNLIYTGLTRAKKYAVFIGQRKSLELAVNNNNYEKRQTSLKAMLLDNSFVNPLI
jgi:ATP-dependent exoDNAse (exonuclease V) alpha subunit